MSGGTLLFGAALMMAFNIVNMAFGEGMRHELTAAFWILFFMGIAAK